VGVAISSQAESIVLEPSEPRRSDGANGAPDAPKVPDHSEHRGDARFHANVEVGIETDSNFYAGFSENLSEGGVFVATYDLRPVGSEMALTLRLPGSDEPIRVRGEVRWVREHSDMSDQSPGMGVHFAQIDQQDVPRIRDFLRMRPPLFFDDE
jgi:uncharacterized protein (TIGR02266 family)